MNTQEITTTSTNNIETNSIARKRIQRDLNEIKNHGENTSIIFADPIDDNFLHLGAAILGPMSTPYENGVFLLDLKLTDQYPFRPPQSITFKRATYHPNVNEYGRFMSNLLKSEGWLPSMTIKNILEHIWALLAVPDIDSNECDLIRADSYKTDKGRFETMAREYSVKYAQAT